MTTAHPQPDRLAKIYNFMLERLSDNGFYTPQSMLCHEIVDKQIVAAKGKTPQHTVACDFLHFRKMEAYVAKEEPGIEPITPIVYKQSGGNRYFYKKTGIQKKMDIPIVIPAKTKSKSKSKLKPKRQLKRKKPMNDIDVDGDDNTTFTAITNDHDLVTDFEITISPLPRLVSPLINEEDKEQKQDNENEKKEIEGQGQEQVPMEISDMLAPDVECFTEPPEQVATTYIGKEQEQGVNQISEGANEEIIGETSLCVSKGEFKCGEIIEEEEEEGANQIGEVIRKKPKLSSFMELVHDVNEIDVDSFRCVLRLLYGQEQHENIVDLLQFAVAPKNKELIEQVFN